MGARRMNTSLRMKDLPSLWIEGFRNISLTFIRFEMVLLCSMSSSIDVASRRSGPITKMILMRNAMARTTTK